MTLTQGLMLGLTVELAIIATQIWAIWFWKDKE